MVINIYVENFEESKNIHSVDMSTDSETYFHVNVNLYHNNEFTTAATYEYDNVDTAMKVAKKLAKRYKVPYHEYFGS